MGQNNKARRAAKAKARSKARARHRADHPHAEGPPDAGGFHEGPNGFFADPVEQVAGLWWLIGKAHRDGDPALPAMLTRLREWGGVIVDRGVQQSLLQHVDLLFQHGWQPEELRRQAQLSGPASAARLVEVAILADHDQRRHQAMDPRWVDQISGLSQRTVSTRGAWATDWRTREGLARQEGYEKVAAAIASITYLPPIEELIPPPGSSQAADERRAGSAPGTRGEAGADPVLQRIRKLLSKAESTGYEAEAAALTAKAQELMTRHAIDLAMVAEPEDAESPRMIRIPIDAPYADAKSYLLQVVAHASRSRSIYLTGVAMSTVAGHASDLVGVELVFTSLLVQARNALTEDAATAPAGTRTRSQSYRSAFYLAFAHRIDERLCEANVEVFAEAEKTSGRFLPVLRAREQQVEDFVTERFGDLVSGSVRGGYDPAGWAAGRNLGDRAKLDSGELLR